MASLKSIELKFLLKLLSFDDYRSKIGDIKPNSKTPVSDIRRICEHLVARGYVECNREILEFVISASGKTLLVTGVENLPIQPSSQEMRVLEVAKRKVTPGKLGKKVPPAERQDLLHNMAERGLIDVKKAAIKEAWLSVQGKQFLKESCEPTGNGMVTATMLGNYVRFLRSSGIGPAVQWKKGSVEPGPLEQGTIDTDIVLSRIKQLDQQVGNDNFLPIFYLREKLQPPLTRSELDSMLYALQREGKIDLSSLHDQGKYSQSQMAAGIMQDNGGYLFFISIL